MYFWSTLIPLAKLTVVRRLFLIYRSAMIRFLPNDKVAMADIDVIISEFDDLLRVFRFLRAPSKVGYAEYLDIKDMVHRNAIVSDRWANLRDTMPGW